jgi:class 3 adenylate cyclase
MERTFAFVDLAGFSALTEAHGGDAAADLVERFTAVVDDVLHEDAGRVRTIGDAVFLVAPSPAPALRVLERLWDRARREESFPVLRAGLHHGEAVQRGTDYFGTGVNVAARVAAMAGGGQILATVAVADAARAEGRDVTALGNFELKNLRDRVDVYAIRLESEPDAEVVDPVCRMRVSVAKAAARLQIGGRDYYFCSKECAGAFFTSNRA